VTSPDGIGDGLQLDSGGDGVATITIMRGPNNYLSPSLTASMAELIEDLSADGQTRVVVLATEGKHFCAGADFRGEMAEPGAPAMLYGQVARLLRTELPIVAAVQGAAIGGGVGLALVADFRVATESTRFACTFSRLGFHHGFGLSVTLPNVIGHQRASELLYTGRSVDGTEAQAIGLCDRLAAADDLTATAQELAAEIAAAAPLAVRSIRATMRGDLADRVDQATVRELAEQDRLKRTADFREGLRASAERRAPVFEGR
jgi:2-(1,2-epoxy-1,2-dihydrophenyl)acetyl-CoA isomerase